MRMYSIMWRRPGPSITLLRHHEALFQQNHIGGFFGDIYGGSTIHPHLPHATRRALIPSPMKPTTCSLCNALMIRCL